MATTSQIPAFITGLRNAVVNALSSTTTIVDGPPLYWDPMTVPAPGGASDTQFLFIGARPDDDVSADAQQTRNTLGTSRTEDTNVICTALAKGSAEMLPATRQTAFGIVAAVEQAIRVDQTLGGAVAWSVLASVDRLDQQQHDDGGYAVVLFTVTGRAFLR